MITHNDEAVDKVLRFTQHCRISKGKWESQPITLVPWQVEFVEKVFGTYDDDARLYRTAFLGLPRSNGKSTFCAFLATYLGFADNEAYPEVVIASSQLKQSLNIYNEIEYMVMSDPKLKARCHPVPSQKMIRLHRPIKKGELVKANGSIRAITAMGQAAKQASGMNLSACFVDEVHEINNKDFLDKLRYSCSKNRRHSLLCHVSTAGNNKMSPCYSLWHNSLAVAQGKVIDPTHYSCIYAATEEDRANLDDPAMWHRANPSMAAGIVDEKRFKQELEIAKYSTLDLNSFLWQRLNIWVNTNVASFIELGRWDNLKKPFPNLDGKECIIGCDLSSSTDLSSLVQIIEHEKVWYIRCWAWTTQDAIRKRDKQNLTSYNSFMSEGNLELVDGEVIDYGEIRNKIAELNAINPVKDIVVEQWGSTETCQILMKKYHVVQFPPYPSNYHGPTKRLQDFVLANRLGWDGKQLLRWCINNLQVKKDNKGLLYPTKNKGTSEKQDCAVALILALSQVVSDYEALQPRKSVYETNSPFFVG